MYTPFKEFILEVPIRRIEEVFGAGNFDNFGDVLCELLTEHNSSRKYACQWHWETSHSNPWYHTFVVKIKGISQDVFDIVLRKIQRLNLMD
jgi:hypothetical protein